MSKYFFWASGSTKMEQPFLSGPVLGLKPWAQHRKYREKTPKEGEKLDRRGPQGLRVAWGRSPVCPSPGTAETSRLEPPIGAERKSRRRLFPMTARRPEKGGPREQKDVSAVPTLLCQIPMEHAGPPQCHGLTRHWTSTAFAEVMVRPAEVLTVALKGVDLWCPTCPHVHLPNVICREWICGAQLALTSTFLVSPATRSWDSTPAQRPWAIGVAVHLPWKASVGPTGN